MEGSTDGQELDEASSHRDKATRRAKVQRTRQSVRQLEALLDSPEDYEARFGELLDEHPEAQTYHSPPRTGPLETGQLGSTSGMKMIPKRKRTT